MTSQRTDEELQSLVVNGGNCTAFIKMMNVGSARPTFNMLQKLVDSLFRPSWKKRLPPDHRDILSRAFPPLNCKSEKEFYEILFDDKKGTKIDEGGKWFSLDRVTHAKRYVISARKLTIIWSDDERYYKWITLPESESCKFREVAELRDVCWLDIAGSIDSRDLSPKTNYGAYLILKVAADNYGLDEQAAEISVKVGGTVNSGTAYLRPNKKTQLMMQRLQYLYKMQVLSTNPSKYVQRQGIKDVEDKKDKEEENEKNGSGNPKAANDRPDDDWMEIELGTFSIDGDDGMVEMKLLQTGSNWKRGLIIQGIEVRPVSTEKKETGEA